MHSVKLEPTKLILIGTRTTYQATGDAGVMILFENYPEGNAVVSTFGTTLSVVDNLEPQSRFGYKPVKLEVVCPQNGTAVKKKTGLTPL